MNRGSCVVRLAAVLSLLCAWSPGVSAADAATGQQLYRQNCAGCHAVDPRNDPNGAQGVRNGAGAPNTIRSAFATVEQMKPFNFGATLPATAPDNIAAYLAGVFGGTPPPPTPGQLLMPSPVAFGAQTVGTQGTPVSVAIVNIGGSAVTILSVANSNATEFPVVSSTCTGNVAAGASCQISAAFLPSAAGARSATITVTSTGTGSPQSFALSGSGTTPAPPPVAPNYEGLWYNAPAESESGWGINFAHQGDIIFLTWFTYDLNGKAWWLTMQADKKADRVYSGTLLETRGPAFNAVPFRPTGVTRNEVGPGTLTFSDANNGSFAYTVNGVSQTKAITRQMFGPLPTCVWGAQPNLTLATNFQDIWYAAPAESESGWGVNFTHQGDIIFATWFTYDFDGTPLWLSVQADKKAPGVYTGDLLRTNGPAFNAVPFNPKDVKRTPAGTLTITFANGNSASYAYTVALPGQISVTQNKAITRQVFHAPGTVCQ